MTSRLPVALVTVAALLVSSHAAAQPPQTTERGQQCLAALAALVPERANGANDERDPCFALANQLFDLSMGSAEKRAEASMTGADVARRGIAAGLAGTVAQSSAVPAVMPAGVAAGTIAAVGTNGGQDALAAISINPAVWFIADTATRALAKASRVADVTLLIPVSGITMTPSDEAPEAKSLRYFGARVRLNFHGLSAGDAVWTTVRNELRRDIERQGQSVEAIERVLTTTSDVTACATALHDGPSAEVEEACGASVDLRVDELGRQRLRNALAQARRLADAKYFGLDLRFDSGDPTLGAVADSRGTYLFAGLAMGRRFGGATDAAPSPNSTGVQLRLGVRHAKLDGVAAADFAVDAGAGLEFVRSVGDDEVTVTAGVEGRWSRDAEALAERLQTNMAVARLSLSLPLTAGHAVSVSTSLPLSGDVSPTMSVSFNWALLLPGKRQ